MLSNADTNPDAVGPTPPKQSSPARGQSPGVPVVNLVCLLSDAVITAVSEHLLASDAAVVVRAADVRGPDGAPATLTGRPALAGGYRRQ